MIDRLTPALVFGELVFAQIEAGEAHSCAVASDGQAYCWGKGEEFRLGNGSSNDRMSPALVLGDLAFSQVSAGAKHSCAVGSARDAYCWGDGASGKLGTGNTNTASAAAAGDAWIPVRAGERG